MLAGLRDGCEEEEEGIMGERWVLRRSSPVSWSRLEGGDG